MAVAYWKCTLLMLLFVAVAIKDANLKTFDITCDLNDKQSQENCSSMTLTRIAATTKRQSNIQINIRTPILRLKDTVMFSNLTSLAIMGEPGLTVITCTADNDANAGIVLSNITGKITLSNFNLTFCGSIFRVGVNEDNSDSFSSALTIVHSTNVEMSQIVIARSRGRGLAVLDHQGGKVKVLSTIFLENKLSQEYTESTEQEFGGGGIYIALEQHQRAQYSDTSFTFEDCIFINNNSTTSGINRLPHTDVLDKGHKGYGRGGGAYIMLKYGLVNIYVSFFRCQFIANLAFAGGGLSIMIQGEGSDHNVKVSVDIIDSVFEHNGCDKCNGSANTRFGGGLQLILNSNVDESHTHYLVKNVNFTKNCAERGGAMFHSSHGGRSNSNSMLFDDCMFKHNTAHMGSAVALIPNHSLKLFSGYTVIPTFQNCYFLDNLVYEKHFQSHDTQRNSGVGTIYTSLYNLHFQGTNVFENNWGSGLFIVNGIINFTTTEISFINNTGLYGGAVALIGTSTMILGQNNYDFINNTALHQGGAVYVFLIDHNDYTISGNCFMQHTDDPSVSSNKWNANINFNGNKALHSLGGHAIYATSLYPCQIVNADSANQSENTSVDVFTIRGIKFDSDDALQPQIATDGSWLKLTKSTPLTIIPGEKYYHGVVVTDDLGQPADASFKANFNSKSNGTKLNRTDITFIGSSVQVTGEPDSNATLYLHPVSPRHNYIKLEVNLLHCPPGFKLNQYSECACNAHVQFGLLKCDEENLHSYLLPGYWAGHIDDSKLLTSECPFCEYRNGRSSTSEFEIVLPQHVCEIDETVCGETRTGVVCGKCRDNFTVHFHSPGFLCKPSGPVGCKLGWFFYLLSELVPVTAVFILVFVFNISFTSGEVNGFILFSQLLGSLDIYAGGITVFSATEKQIFYNATQGYRIIYGFFNLEFFNGESLSFCLWKDASALDMLAFKYVTILYAILLVIAVIFIMNSCGGRCLGRYYRITTIKVSVIHGISTFLVICYAQCIRISLSLLLPVHLHTAQNVEINDSISSRRVWFNGELTHLGKDHWLYAAPALFCLLTVGLLPPVLLLTYPLLNKTLALFGLEEKKPFHIFLSMSWLKPLLDSFQGCFRDNFRFFSGLYFLYRWTFLLIHWNTVNFSAYYTGTGGILMFMLTLHTVCQPYIKRVHNIIDTLLFANLVLVNSLSFFNYHKTRSQKVQYSATVSAAVVQQVLIYLPLIVIGTYLMTILCQQVMKYGICRNSKFLTKQSKLMKLIRTISSEDTTTEEEFVCDRITDEDVEYEHFEDWQL